MPDDSEKPELRPAAGNPWYVLMTVAGEQTDDEIDKELHARNRRYWNGWAAQALSEDKKAKLIADDRATEADLAEMTEAERAAIDKVFYERCPGTQWPKPESCVDLRYADFTTVSCADNFLCPYHAFFIRAVFSRNATFKSATFSGLADFTSATFSGFAGFMRATFSGGADFRNATFSGFAGFGQTIFGYGDFASATFSGRAIFVGSTFSGFASFASATFSIDADFNDATFGAVTSFGPCHDQNSLQHPVRFVREPPRLFGATLHEDTDFTDVVWPPVPDDDDPQWRRRRAIRHRRAYERLKLLMDSQKRVADELMFQRLELRCREAEVTGNWRSHERWVARASRLYGLLSDYGWDPVRPVIGLGVLISFGWALIFVAEWAGYHLGTWPDPQRPPEYLGFWQSLSFSLSNTFGFLGFNRTFLHDEVATLTACSQIVSAVQTFVGLILVFLLGLTLRNRFRIK